jgi:hypothetical protein
VKLDHRRIPSWQAPRSLLLLGLVAGSLAACSEPTSPTPKGSGTLVLIPGLRAEDLSSDGKTVLLTDLASATADFYFYDIASGTSTLKGAAGDLMFDFTTGISNGLRVSAIHGKPENAGLWQQTTGWTDLGNIYPTGCEYDDVTHQQDQSGGWDIDSAGHVAVGLIWHGCNAEAFLWSDAGGAGGFTALDLLGDSTQDVPAAPPINRATVISDNGLVAGGFASHVADIGGTLYWIDRWPALWQANGTGTMLPSNAAFSDDCPGEVLAISADGSTVAGVWCQMPFLWNATLGVVNLAPGGFGWGQAVALNGQLVFGTSAPSSFDQPTPFVWTKAAGVKSLLDIAAAHGITIPPNYSWGAVVAASADGTVVVGTVYDETYKLYTYVMKLPVSVYGL